MKDFRFHLPTKIYFARGNFQKVGEILGDRWKRILLVTGKKFAREYGLVDSLRKQLKGTYIIHYDGITPNPKVDEVIEASGIVREEKLEMVLALGGGSVMDASKVIAAYSVSEGELWDYISGKKSFSGALPVVAIPTVAASGSEADPYAVITHPELKEKRGVFSPFFYPEIAIWDPKLTYTLSLTTLGDGVVDIISHALEGYISGEKASLQNGFTEIIIKEVMGAWEKIIRGEEPGETRDILCWASTLAISQFLSAGRNGHFVLHGIEHAISGIYDHVSHGAGLAALMVPYLFVVGRKRPERVSALTKALFDVYHWETGLKELEEWFKGNKLFRTLTSLGADDLDAIEEKAWETSGERLASVGLSREELREILELAR